MNIDLNWEKTSGGANRIVIPKCLTGCSANIIVLTPGHFPTFSSNDATAYTNLKYMIESKNIIDNTIEVCALDNAIPSYAWAASVLGLKCIIHCPQMTPQYWLKRANDYGATIMHSGVNNSDAPKIIKANRKKRNFISQFETFAAYTFHSHVTKEWIEKAVLGIGNNKLVLLSFPASSGALSGAAQAAKEVYPYSKTLLVEPSISPTFYSNKKGNHKLEGMGYGFIPYIHNILATDYVMLIEQEEVIRTLKCIEEFNEKIITDYNADSKTVKPIVGKFGVSTIACIISAITLAQQLYLSDEDNIVVISEDTAQPYNDLLKSIILEDYDVKPIIDESLINSRYLPVLDVTGQRQRERLFKKKKDFWTKYGYSDSDLELMREPEFWEKLPRF